MNKIGLFGGTFNPIHLGHLRAAEEIADTFGLGRVVFIPSSHPPHKRKEGILAAPLRAQMVRLAVADNSRFALSEIELDRPGTSYSIETVEYFRGRFEPGTGIYFIVGLDAFLEIHTWKNYAALFGLCHFVVMTRPGLEKKISPEFLPVELAGDFCYDTQKCAFTHTSGFTVYPAEIEGLDISSTRIREFLRKGKSVRYLIPPAVEAFIRTNRLYQDKDTEKAG